MNAMYFDSVVALGGTLEYPSTRRPFNVGHLVSLSMQGIATDPVGTTTLTLQNVVNGSHIQIETQDGTTTRHYAVYATGDPPIVLNVYEQGSALNDLRLKIRKGTSAPYYRPFETLVTLSPTPSSIYVSQIQDD
jgi:hypothetical protein